MRIFILAIALLPMSAALAQTPAQDAAGSALLQKNCAACHPVTQVTSAHKTKEEWVATLDKMIGFGAQISDADYDVLAGYLTQHHGVEKK